MLNDPRSMETTNHDVPERVVPPHTIASRWMEVGIFLTVLFAYMLGESRTPPYNDSKQIYTVAESIIYRKTIELTTPGAKVYAQHPFLPSAIHVPGVVLRWAMTKDNPAIERLVKPITSHIGTQILSALGCLVFFRLLLHLGISLGAASLSEADLAFAQDHLGILSGLYGLLRPLDLIQPYRLEMGTRLANPKGGDLAAFWSGTLTRALGTALAREGGPLINLASGEFFKALEAGKLPGRIITPVFEDLQKGGYRVVSLYAKRARGLMVRFAVKGRLQEPEGLKAFREDGYAFDAPGSGRDRWVFRR